MEVVISSLEEMCMLMCDNIVPEGGEFDEIEDSNNCSDSVMDSGFGSDLY